MLATILLHKLFMQLYEDIKPAVYASIKEIKSKLLTGNNTLSLQLCQQGG